MPLSLQATRDGRGRRPYSRTKTPCAEHDGLIAVARIL